MVRRLGGKTELKVDVRVIAATNKDPGAAMQAGHVPGGPVLPAQRVQLDHAAAPAAQGGHPAPRRGLRRRSSPPSTTGPPRRSPRRRWRSWAARVARQRARAAQLPRARGDREHGAPDLRRRCYPWPFLPGAPPRAAGGRRAHARAAAEHDARRGGAPPHLANARRPRQQQDAHGARASASASRRCTTSCAATAPPEGRPPGVYPSPSSPRRVRSSSACSSSLARISSRMRRVVGSSSPM